MDVSSEGVVDDGNPKALVHSSCERNWQAFVVNVLGVKSPPKG